MLAQGLRVRPSYACNESNLFELANANLLVIGIKST